MSSRGTETEPLQEVLSVAAEAARAAADKSKFDFALPHLLMDLTSENLPPVMYLKAAGEGLFATLLISWIITLIVHPEVAASNPLKERLGYNNLCVGWDRAPARYIAAALWIIVAYLALRFLVMNRVRYTLLEEKDPSQKHTFGKFANVSFAVAVCVFTLCLVIPPDDQSPTTVYFHTIPFIGFIVTRCLIVTALVVEKWSETSTFGKIFTYVYCFISVSLPIIYLSEYAYYSEYGEKSPFPYQITFAMDYAWFACLALTSKVLASNVVIHRTFELITLSQEVVV